jgi:hypothetical protein
MASIYLDYNASTPIDPAVSAAMRPFLADAFGNPSSGHWASVPAKDALEKARGQVAGLIGCAADEVVFTSGGSEANTLALKGAFFALRHEGEHIITTAVEHPVCVLEPVKEQGTQDYRRDEIEVSQRHPATIDRIIGRQSSQRIDRSGGELPGRKVDGRRYRSCSMTRMQFRAVYRISWEKRREETSPPRSTPAP